MKYSLEWILEKHNQGDKLKYLFFWGHQPKPDGTIGESCLSQWWIAPFEADGIRYPSTEHYMMAEKARVFGDEETLAKIRVAKLPAEAKKLGREIQDFVPAVWEANRYQIVKTGNLYKFEQNPELKQYLLNTGDRILVEASPVDNIWGIGLPRDNSNVYNPEEWQGLNLLGFALMEVRDELQQGRI